MRVAVGSPNNVRPGRDDCADDGRPHYACDTGEQRERTDEAEGEKVDPARNRQKEGYQRYQADEATENRCNCNFHNLCF